MKDVDTQMEIAIKCVHCGEMNTIYGIKTDDYQRWVNQEGYIQDILYYLLPFERELLLSGCCDACFVRMFGDDADNEEDLGIDEDEPLE